MLLASPWGLVLLGLGVRLLTPRSGPTRWRTPIELGLALACGVALVLLTATFLADFAVVRGPRMGADLTRYCGCVADLRSGDLADWHNAESLAAAWLPATLARSLGVVEGLAWASLIGTGLLGAALYLWGRALHGRLAGISAALLAGALGPLALLPLELSFYPGFLAASALSAAGAALALRYRTTPAVAAGSAGAGLMLLTHVKGLIWALPVIGLTAVAALWLARTRPLRATLALFVPLLIAWQLGGQAFAPDATLLEVQGAVQINTAAGYQAVRDPPPPLRLPDGRRAPPSAQGFVWGHSDPRLVVTTLRALADQNRQAPDLWDSPRNVEARAMFFDPSAPVLAGAALLALVGLIRRPWQLLGLIGTGVPFAVSLNHALHTDALPRFLATAYPLGAVALGLAWAVLCCGDAGARPAERTWRDWRAWIRPAAVSALALLLVLGVLPTPLSPVAPAKAPQNVSRRPHVLIGVEQARLDATDDPAAAVEPALRAALGPNRQDWASCARGLASDAERGLALWPGWFPR